MPWLQDRPRILQWVYLATHRALKWTWPVLSKAGMGRVNRFFIPLEEALKKPIFDCRMCGQCILHSTGMTCPMTCPKELRNGPCGGVRANGNCEVIPDMPCVWVKAWERSALMGAMGQEIIMIQPPVNRDIKGSAAWVNMLTGIDRKPPAGWPISNP